MKEQPISTDPNFVNDFPAFIEEIDRIVDNIRRLPLYSKIKRERLIREIDDDIHGLCSEVYVKGISDGKKEDKS
jgi:hypothetical protein